jgi:hypothetical protein
MTWRRHASFRLNSWGCRKPDGEVRIISGATGRTVASNVIHEKMSLFTTFSVGSREAPAFDRTTKNRSERRLRER